MKKFTILVVDDDKNFVYTLTEILRLQNWAIEIATNGYDAVRLVKQKNFDLILLDVRLPGVDGVQTFQEIKKVQPGAIIFMMSGGPIDNLKDLQKQGVSAVLQKPLDMMKIVSMITDMDKKGTVLIVDDNDGDREILSDILTKKGFKVVEAKTGKEAITTATEGEFDIILLDIRLPDMNGTEVLEKIKHAKPASAVIAITGYSVNEIIENVTKQGAYTCFLKPFDVETLIQEMNFIIAKRDEIEKKADTDDMIKILLVEDNDGIRETLQDILDSEGFNVQTAASVHEAEQKIEQNDAFNVVLSDLSLGKESGLMLIDSVRKKEKATIFIIMTGYGTLETAMEAIKKNVDEYILKPVNPVELIHKVRTYIDNQKLNREKEGLVKKLQESNIKLLEISKSDDLTGVFNRRYFFEEVNNEMQRAKRQKNTLGLMMCDVDGFKKFNDTRGHIEGDRILRQIAVELQSSVREYVDKVFRYGGDEFIVIMPEIEKETMLKVGQRIVARVKENFGANDIGISIGISHYSLETQHMSLNELIDLADKKLYEAKKSSDTKVMS
jgi:two-component system cell cycle response regulator